MKIKALDKQENLLRDFLEYLHLSEEMCGEGVVNYLGGELFGGFLPEFPCGVTK